MSKPPNNDDKTNNQSSNSFEERRRHKRIQKNFVMTYFEKNNPHIRYEITQLKNISIGGMCFITNKAFSPETILCVELKTPYLSDITHLEGEVLGSNEKTRNLLYETRLKFKLLDPKAEYLMKKLIEFFVNGDPGSHE